MRTTEEIRAELQEIKREGVGVSNYEKQFDRLLQILFDLTKHVDGIPLASDD